MKKLLISRTRHDHCNSYLYAYSENIIDEAAAHGWKIEKAEDEDDNKATISSRLTNKPHLAVFNGHGSENDVLGYQDKPIITSSDVGILAGTVSFIRACGCLGGFGKVAVEKGAKAVVGYRGNFWISKTNQYSATPLKDPTAKPVLDASNKVALKLIKGATVKDAVEASKRQANDAILQMLTREEPYESATIKALIVNNLQLGFEGKETTTV